MSEKKLLIETNLFEYNKENINGKIILKGVLQRADVKNQNNRIYPRSILERELKNYQVLINERRALGELDHPNESVVELKNVSHLVTRLWWEGNDVLGEVELLNTPMGKIAQSLVESGVKLGISSRAVGSVNEQNGVSTVQNDLTFCAFDLVGDPSTKGAFLYKESRQLENFDLSKVNVILESGKSEPLFTKEYRINRILNKLLCNCEEVCSI